MSSFENYTPADKPAKLKYRKADIEKSRNYLTIWLLCREINNVRPAVSMPFEVYLYSEFFIKMSLVFESEYF